MARNNFRIAVLADIHYGPNKGTLPGREALERLEEWVQSVNAELHPDLVVDLGDRINSENPAVDYERMQSLAGIFSRLVCPWYGIHGNHDLDNLDKAQCEKALGKPLGNQFVDLNGYRLVFLDSQDPVIEGIGGHVSKSSLSWLHSTVDSAEGPCIVFVHQAVDDHDLSDNIHFNDISDMAYIKNKDAVHKILSDQAVKVILNGHLHRGAPRSNESRLYLTVPSFTDAWNDKGRHPSAFTVLEVTPERIIIDHHRSLFHKEIERISVDICVTSQEEGKK